MCEEKFEDQALQAWLEVNTQMVEAEVSENSNSMHPPFI